MHKKIIQTITALLLTTSLCIQAEPVAAASPEVPAATETAVPSEPSSTEEPTPGPTSEPVQSPEPGNIVCILDDREVPTAGISLTYNGKKVNTKKTPVILYQGEYMVAYEPVFVKQGPKISYEYDERSGHVKMIRENYLVTFYTGDDYLYASSCKVDLAADIQEGTYIATDKSYYFIPLEKLCQALGLSCQWKQNGKTLALKGKKVRYAGKKRSTRYAYSRRGFARKEYRSVRRISYSAYLSLVTVSRDTTAGFKYLRVDHYRPVDKKKFRQFYQYLIRDYCRQAGIRVKKSSLYGKADTFLKAAKKYNLDPVYLVNQTFLESAYGTSWLASGNRIKKVANRGYPRNRRGKFITHKIKKSVKVYNLYGIKAYDADPYVGGTSYAYYHHWTTVTRAIYGAASYLKSNYVGRTNRQNTPFKMRYTFRKNIWHQYATDPFYAEKIGTRMYQMSSCYAKNAGFLYDYPKYR